MKPIFYLSGRIWLETNGEKVLGHGRVELLERIHESGSIRQAALQMNMSYRQAWELVKHINTNFSTPVVLLYRGGRGGGNAVLTDNGLQLIKEFHALQASFKMFLQLHTKNMNFDI